MVYIKALHQCRVPLFSLGRVTTALLAMVVLEIVAPQARAGAPSEYELKAVFLLNFARFNTWPASALPPGDAPLVVGVLGIDPFGHDLEAAFQGEQVAGHSLQIRHFSRGDDYWNCHLLFISRSEAAHLTQIFSALRGKHVLTVSDIDEFIYKDGMIGMLLEQNRVKVQVNYDKTRSEELELSAKLLKMSFVLRNNPHSLLRTSSKLLCQQENPPLLCLRN